MKTCLFLSCYLDGLDHLGDYRITRYEKYISYYRPLKERLGFSKFVFIDNGSSMSSLRTLEGLVGFDDVVLFRHPDHLPRDRNKPHHYPFGWRMIFSARKFLDDFDRIVFLDSDSFVLSEKLANWVKHTLTGWQTIWCARYRMPEGNISILNRDVYSDFKEWTGDDYEKFLTKYLGRMMEVRLPFTYVDKDFICDRFGDTRELQRPEMDFYGQCPVDIPLKFNAFT